MVNNVSGEIRRSRVARRRALKFGDLQRPVEVPVEFVEIADGAFQNVRHLFDLGRIDRQIRMIDESGVLVAAARIGLKVNEEQPAPRGGSERGNFAFDEGRALLLLINLRVEQHDIHLILAHAFDGLRRVFRHKGFVTVFD